MAKVKEKTWLDIKVERLVGWMKGLKREGIKQVGHHQCCQGVGRLYSDRLMAVIQFGVAKGVIEQIYPGPITSPCKFPFYGLAKKTKMVKCRFSF